MFTAFLTNVVLNIAVLRGGFFRPWLRDGLGMRRDFVLKIKKKFKEKEKSAGAGVKLLPIPRIFSFFVKDDDDLSFWWDSVPYY